MIIVAARASKMPYNLRVLNCIKFSSQVEATGSCVFSNVTVLSPPGPAALPQLACPVMKASDNPTNIYLSFLPGIILSYHKITDSQGSSPAVAKLVTKLQVRDCQATCSTSAAVV